MKLHTIKTRYKNRLLMLLPMGVGLIYVIIYVIRFFLQTDDISPKDFASFLRTISYVGMVITVLMPFITTFFVTRLVLQYSKDQSTVDYLTYANESTLRDFEWQEAPLERFLGSHFRQEIIDSNPPNDAGVESVVATEPVFPGYSTAAIDDLPEYDPTGPNPFQKNK